MAEEKVIHRKPAREMAAHRERLRAINPNCHWCSRPTLPTTPPPFHPDMATVDHLRPRWECVSAAEYHAVSNLVLACYECNTTRDKIERVTKGENQRQKEARERVTGPCIERVLQPSGATQWL